MASCELAATSARCRCVCSGACVGSGGDERYLQRQNAPPQAQALTRILRTPAARVSPSRRTLPREKSIGSRRAGAGEFLSAPITMTIGSFKSDPPARRSRLLPPVERVTVSAVVDVRLDGLCVRQRTARRSPYGTAAFYLPRYQTERSS